MAGSETAPSGTLWNREYNRVMATNFFLFFAMYTTLPLLPLYMSEVYGASKDTIGAVLSGFTISALILRPLSGWMLDTFKRKNILLLCLFANALLFGMYLAAASVLVFATVRTLHGGIWGASTVANSTVAIDVLPSDRRSEGLGYYGLSNNIATAIAPTVSLWLYHQSGSFDALFFLSLASATIALAADSFVKIPKDEQRTAEQLKPKARFSTDRFFLTRGWLVAINVTFFGYCYGGLANYLAIYGKECLGTTDGTGLFFALLSLGLILSRVFGGKSLREGRVLQHALLGIAVSTAGYIIFVALPNSVGYYGAALLVGLGNGHLWPAFQNMFVDMAHKNERGTANSTLLTAWDLGMGLGLLCGGVVAEYFGYRQFFCTVVAIHTAGAVLFGLKSQKFYLKNCINEN